MRFFLTWVLVPVFCLVISKTSNAQNTLGLLTHDPELTSPGYNLFFPHNQSTVFLVDNCGELVHQWTDADSIRPGNAVELLPDGKIVVCKRPSSAGPNDPIWAGGGGQIVEIRSWDNELEASFSLNNDKFRLHHDIAPLPDGNILMIAWALKTREECIAAGRDPALLPDDEVWSEAILEWDPVADSIVWEWDVWDHLIQEYDATKDNFGVVADHPERIHINYDERNGNPDWLHINGIAYNPVLDQFVLSVPGFNEIWVIDHSTTTEEAAGSTGGRSGRGGDLLYRWGNPAAYGRGTEADKQLFFQHDIHWPFADAQPGEEGFGEMIVFNNRVASDKSTASTFATPFDTATWTYTLDQGAYGPADFTQTRFHPATPPQGVSSGVSSVQLLPNGNWLICSGRWGFSYELAADSDEVVWEYITPIKFGQPAVQGDTLAINNNLTFRLKRYAPDYPAFAGRDLSPKGYIEENPNVGFCGLTVSLDEPQHSADWTVFPNPARDLLTISWDNAQSGVLWELYSPLGQRVRYGRIEGTQTTIATGAIPTGMYVLRVGESATRVLIR